MLARVPWRTLVIGGMVACLVIAVTLTFWPKGLVGFFVAPSTNKIIFIEPELARTGADLQLGDRLLMIYGLRWEDVLNRWRFFDLAPSPGGSIPLVVERQGVIYTLEIIQQPPSVNFQLGKLINILLALCCCITGFKLGNRAYYEGIVPSGIDMFWFGISVVVGTHSLAGHGSLPLLVVLEWVMITLLVPYLVVMHTFFPYRPQTNTAIVRSERQLLMIFVFLNSIIVAVILVQQPSLIELVNVLNQLLSSMILLAFIGSGIILYRAYRHTTIIHVRRQMRVLMSAYIGVATLWFGMFTLPDMLSNTPLPNQFIHLATIVIPCAYLVSGVIPNLYRIDRIVLRSLCYLITFTTLLILARVSLNTLDIGREAKVFWMAIAIVVFFNPTMALIQRLFPLLRTVTPYQPLYQTMADLTTTLDFHLLTPALLNGLRATFQQPALGIYLCPIADPSLLNCMHQDHMPDLPSTVSDRSLLQMINKNPFVVNSATIRSHYPHHDSNGETSLVYQAQITLWCPIHHPKYGLFGLVVLGRRGDLDPYYSQDIHELQRLFNAAGLAFAHSYLFIQQVQAEQTIRDLFIALQRAQDDTARAIARELHDEIINVNIRLNIESLQQLIQTTVDPSLHNELHLIMESEQDTAHALRMICDSLHPSGIDDPLGLTTILRGELERLQPLYHGILTLQVDHTPCPITPLVQRELLRITKEAVMNAINHAQANTIEIFVTYPTDEGSGLTITIRDNGTLNTQIREKPGHFGLRNMMERTHMINGIFNIQQQPMQGTSVVITIPYLSEIEDAQRISSVYAREATSYDQIQLPSHTNSADWHVAPDITSLERHSIFE